MKVIIVFACVLAVAAGRQIDSNIELPPFLRICKLNDPKRNECLRDSIQTFLPASKGKTLANGIKLPQVDPFIYDSVTIGYKNNEIDAQYILRKVRVFGMSGANVHSVKSNFKEGMRLQIEVTIPKIFFGANYNGIMKFRSLEFPSQGDFNFTLKETKAQWNIQGIIENINGEGYMKIVRADMGPTAIEDMKVSISGVFPDESLNKFANTFINQYWRLIYKDLVGEATRQWEPILMEAMNGFFSQIPFRKLLITK